MANPVLLLMRADYTHTRESLILNFYLFMSQDLTTPVYELIGQDEGVLRLVNRFYDLMDEDDSVSTIRQLHPPSLDGSREKLYLFLCGFFGGPQRYVEKYGHPRLRARHLPFKIGNQERDEWLKCMYQAIDEQINDSKLNNFLKQSFERVANHMRNQDMTSQEV